MTWVGPLTEPVPRSELNRAIRAAVNGGIYTCVPWSHKIDLLLDQLSRSEPGKHQEIIKEIKSAYREYCRDFGKTDSEYF